MKVLVVEDDDNIRQGLCLILSDEGYEAIEASNGEKALYIFNKVNPELVCLDIMMPGLSGYEVCKQIRKINENVPIIFLSAKAEEIDKVLGLELGADDYITKPFGAKEVIARIRAVTRRVLRATTANKSIETFSLLDLEVDTKELRARRNDTIIELSMREVKILQLFFENPGKVIDRDTLLNKCWGLNYFPNSRTLDQTISNLRKKIEFDSKNPKIIQTVHAAGYRFE
jgi:DNA-binding response OmpR family regulator